MATREGDRVRLLQLAESSELVKSGDEGVVDLIDDLGTVHVRWDNGASLGLIPRRDRWVTTSTQRHTEEP